MAQKHIYNIYNKKKYIAEWHCLLLSISSSYRNNQHLILIINKPLLLYFFASCSSYLVCCRFSAVVGADKADPEGNDGSSEGNEKASPGDDHPWLLNK